MTTKKPRILFFDLETTPLKAYIWGLGKQVVRHNQLVNNYSQWGIICATYCWNDGKPAQVIDWGYEEQDTGKVVREFDEIIKQADHIIGKNNKRFDDKMLNMARLFNNVPSMPEWSRTNDDLEQQMRRTFRLPSHSLDYISNQLGLGGKIKMQFQDWIDIVEKTPNGMKAFNKMLKYGKKDVEDTRKLWNILSKHFDPKFNAEVDACFNCKSFKRKKSGFSYTSQGRKQRYTCLECVYRITSI
jgi:DNA polymerase elongation subunit (family B)